MRRDLLDILACPLCKTPLTLTVRKEDKQEIIEGTLHCEQCGEDYPIQDSIPNLLPPSLRT